MLLRLIDFLIIGLIIVSGITWVLWHYVYGPRQRAAQAKENMTDRARDKAEVDYLEIRKEWLGFSLKSDEDMVATMMGDMKIPKVSKFQKLMVQLNEKYGNLNKDVPLDEVFVQKVTALRELFDDALIDAKKRSL